MPSFFFSSLLFSWWLYTRTTAADWAATLPPPPPLSIVAGATAPQLYLAGILALFRAMASSTAFSCLSSSSRRDSVLLGLPEPPPPAAAEPEPEPEPAASCCCCCCCCFPDDDGAPDGFPDNAAGPFPDDLVGGDKGRFLSGCRARGRGPPPLGRSILGESCGRPPILLSRPLSGDMAILLLRGEAALSLSEGR